MREGELVAGRYRVGARLGHGGMGQVFRATDERLRREVAVKVVDLTATTDASVAERFHREAVATARLSHPNIVTIFDAGSDGRLAYLVMELLPGRSVAQRLRESGPFAPAEAVRIAGRVARALVATHAIGVVHRDLKPANIMVDGESVKLLDFGIALVSLDAEANLTAPATTVGTAAYMSPEQARGERATAASDVYALGAVLFALLTGTPPYPGDNAIQVASKHITEPVPSVLARRPDVGRPLDDLVRRLMAKNPADRPDASIAVLALDHLAHNLGPAGATAVMPAAGVSTGSTGVSTGSTGVATGSTGVAAGAGGVAAGAGGVRPTPTRVGPPAGYRTAFQTRVAPPPAPMGPPPAPPGPAPASARRYGTGPDAGRPVRPIRTRVFRRAARWLGLLITGILAFMIVWAFGSAMVTWVGDRIASAAPTAQAEPSADPSDEPTSAPRTPITLPSLPSITLPSLPSVSDAALQAAVSGVGLAVDAVDASRSNAAERAAEDLAERWDAVEEAIAEGESPTRALDRFSTQVARHRASGAITPVEAVTIQVALRAVEAAL